MWRGVVAGCALILTVQITPASSGPAGDRQGTIRHGNLTRTYLLHVPPSHSGTRPTPLVLVFHGGYGTGRGVADSTGFNAVSDRVGFIVAYPHGTDRHWNDGRGTMLPDQQNVDDVGFVSALIADLMQTLAVDPKRVYATGISNGGIFSHRLACELSEKIAAIAPVAGAIAEKFAPRCAPRQAVSVVAIHGTEDLFVLWNGGDVRGRIGGKVLSVPETMARWVRLNGCPTAPQIVREPDRDLADGTRVRREAYGPCPNGIDVVLYAVEGGGHTWPGGPRGRLPSTGRVSRDITATEIIWEFFEKHPKR